MKNNQKLALQALSQDLYRVAMGRYRGQTAMADRFALEAKTRITQVKELSNKKQIIEALNSDADRSAEDLLMFSNIVRHRAL